jgi:ABC-2 type transport system permease protein
MPGWLQAVVEVNPVSHLVSAVRGLVHGEAAGSSVLWVLAWAVALVAVLGPLTMRRYRDRA